MWFRRRNEPEYSQHAISKQIGELANLNKLRDAANQKAILYKDKPKKTYQAEVEHYDSAIHAAQEVLAFMLDENLQWQQQHKTEE